MNHAGVGAWKNLKMPWQITLQDNLKYGKDSGKCLSCWCKSPSCGSSGIYDGSFSRTIIDGYGVTTYFLKQKGIEVYSEQEIPMVAERIKMLDNQNKNKSIFKTYQSRIITF